MKRLHPPEGVPVETVVWLCIDCALSAKSEIGNAIEYCYGYGWAEVKAWTIESPTHRNRVYVNKSA